MGKNFMDLFLTVKVAYRIIRMHSNVVKLQWKRRFYCDKTITANHSPLKSYPLYTIFICYFCAHFTAEENCSITMIRGSFKHNRNRRRTTFRFSSDGDPKAKYKCKLDKRKFDDCELLKMNHAYGFNYCMYILFSSI